MCAVFPSLGSATGFMILAALLVTGAGGDAVISQQCKKNRGKLGRVRQYPEDRDATRLWFDYCILDKINEADLIGVSNTTNINLEYNDIADVDLAVFRHVPKLESLSLYNNKLRELPVFPEDSCPRLAELRLEYNQLTTLHDGTFSACTHLQELHLSRNLITYIHPDVFSALTELQRLYLHYNKLSLIPDRMLENNKKLKELYIHNNRLTYLPQDFASSFKRADGTLVSFNFHGNPWRCACLLELLADVKRAGVSYYNWYEYDGTRLVCAYSAAIPCRPPLSGLLTSPGVVAGGGL